MMVHVSLLFVAAVAGGLVILVLVTFFKEGPDEGEYLSRIHDLECRLASVNNQKNAYKTAYDSLCRAPKYVDVAGGGRGSPDRQGADPAEGFGRMDSGA